MTRPASEQTVSNTPFARVLTRFMWSKQPPWSAAKTAAVLGIHRTRVANWVYHGIIPELDTMLVVMAHLGIPISELLDAYVDDGVPVPPLGQMQRQPAQPAQRPGSSDYYAVPGSRRSRATEPATEPTSEPSGEPTSEPSGEPASAESVEPAQQPAPAQQPDEWETMIAHTREVMGLSGMPPAAIDAMLNHIRQVRDSGSSEAEAQTQRRIAEEHAEHAEHAEPTTAPRQPERQTRAQRPHTERPRA